MPQLVPWAGEDSGGILRENRKAASFKANSSTSLPDLTRWRRGPPGAEGKSIRLHPPPGDWRINTN